MAPALLNVLGGAQDKSRIPPLPNLGLTARNEFAKGPHGHLTSRHRVPDTASYVPRPSVLGVTGAGVVNAESSPSKPSPRPRTPLTELIRRPITDGEKAREKLSAERDEELSSLRLRLNSEIYTQRDINRACDSRVSSNVTRVCDSRISLLSSQISDVLSPRMVQVSPRWLPQCFNHCKPSPAWLLRKKQRREGPQIRFPEPFDRIMDGVPLEDQPDPMIVSIALRRSTDALATFTDQIVGQSASKQLQSSSCWDPGSLCFSLDTGLSGHRVSPLEFAAATALHRESCKILRLGPVRSEICLSNIALWKNVRSLDISAETIPPNLPASIESLKIKITKGDGKASAYASPGPLFPHHLKKLIMRGGEFCGLLHGVKEAKDLTTVDIAGWESAPQAELLEVAREMMARGGVVVWPSGNVLLEVTGKCDKRAKSAIREEAAKSAEIALHQARMDVQSALAGTNPDIDLRSATDALADALRYGRSMKVDPTRIEQTQADLFKAQGKLWAKDQRPSLLSKLTRQMDGKSDATKKFKRSNMVIKALGIKGENSIPDKVAIQILERMGLEKERASDLVAYADCERKGFIIIGDLAALIDRGAPASVDEMYAFYAWCIQKWKTLKIAFDTLCADKSEELTLAKFERALEKYRWKGIKPRAIFLSLDSYSRSGIVDLEEFQLIEFFKSVHALHGAVALKDYMLKEFGSMESAFKNVDVNGSGAVSREEFQEVLGEKSKNFQIDECFAFIDRDLSGVLESKEFETLKDLDAHDFLRDIQLLKQQLEASCGSLEVAFDEMNVEEQADGTISLTEFIAGVERIRGKKEKEKKKKEKEEKEKEEGEGEGEEEEEGKEGEGEGEGEGEEGEGGKDDETEETGIDPRLLYHFLDTSHDNTVSKDEWLRLRIFNADAAQDGLAESHEKLLQALGTKDPEVAFHSLIEKAREFDKKRKSGTSAATRLRQMR